MIEQLRETIQLADIGVVVCDPFAETFEGDENSNSEVKWAGILWREVARKTMTRAVAGASYQEVLRARWRAIRMLVAAVGH